jgi:hypothetical protein
MMDFDKLLEPYAENGRTVAGQIQWLIKNGIPQNSIDYAIVTIYKTLESGKIFDNGHDLDRELLQVAKEHTSTEAETQMKRRVDEMTYVLDSDWNKLSRAKKLWEVIRGRA